MGEGQRRPVTKMDHLRAMVQETSRQVGSAIGQVKGSHCCLPAKDSGATNQKLDWFTQLKLTEPMKPYFDMSGSGSSTKLLGHSDPGNVQEVHENSNILHPPSPRSPMYCSARAALVKSQEVHEYINTLHPSSPRSPMYCSARAALVKSQDFYDFIEPSLASVASSPISPKFSSAGSSVSSSRDLPPRPKWMNSAVSTLATPQDTPHRSPRRSSTVAALVKSQDLSSSTNSGYVMIDKLMSGCMSKGIVPQMNRCQDGSRSKPH